MCFLKRYPKQRTVSSLKSISPNSFRSHNFGLGTPLYSTHIKTAQWDWFRWECLQYVTQGQAASSSSVFEPVLSVHCLAALGLGAGVEQSSQPIVSSSRAVRPCNPWGSRNDVAPASQPEPARSLGHQEGRRFFWEEPKFFKICPILSNYVQHILPKVRKILHGRWNCLLRPPYLRAWQRMSTFCEVTRGVSGRPT